MRNYLVLLIALITLVACDSKHVLDEYKTISNTWKRDAIINFNFKAPDTIATYDLFINVRNNNTYEFSNLFLESFIKVDPGKILLRRVCFLSWKGGCPSIEDKIKKNVDVILAWGGEEMVASYRRDLPINVKLIDHGPKVSFHIVSLKFFNKMTPLDFQAIAKDISLWDQSACASSQNIFLEKGIDIDSFMLSLGIALEDFPINIHELNIHEESDKEDKFHQALYQEFETGHKAVKHKNFLLQFDSSKALSPTILNRHTKIKVFDEFAQLKSMLSQFSFYLQTCGLAVCLSERATYTSSLAIIGINRFSLPGGMLEGQIGSPHDGSFNLMDLVQVVCDEGISDIKEFALEMTKKLSFYKGELFENFEKIPLINGSDLAEHSIVTSDAFLNPDRGPGKIFSSGGTTGKPKYCFYSNDEFDVVAGKLANSYSQNGIGADKSNPTNIANLFVAGNMWSSFSIIQYALDKLQVNQFPIGGVVGPKDFSQLVKNFKISVLFGLPSFLTDLARQTKGLKIDRIFYAGESFSNASRKIIEEAWNCNEIISAGYASVDVGPIGYQDDSCRGNEHFLFEDLVHLEIVNDEAVITSKVRTSMPIIRYRTGDKVEMVQNELDDRIKFNLLGRVDGQINIWSTRFYQSYIIEIFKKNLDGIDYQIVLKNSKAGEVLSVVTRKNLSSKITQDLTRAFYKGCKDISQTHSLAFFSERVEFNTKEFLVNIKTGKVKIFFDLRE